MKRTILIFMFTVLSLWNSEASAFWGNDSTDATSGLNVAAGFDINTITTIAGKVITQPIQQGQEPHTVMMVAAPQGTVTVVLGPWWYWEKQTIAIVKNQDLTITGSLAQGKDGALYLFAQRLENPSTGETVSLRSESGKPLWSRGGSGNQNRNRPLNGSGLGPGSGIRGSGMRGGRR